MATSDWTRRAFIASGLAMASGLRAQQAGMTYLTPGAEGYEAARQPFNSLITLQPALIAPCGTEEDVAAAIRRAADENLPVAVKSGGHAFHGYSLNQGGMVIELSRMSSLHYDASRERLIAGPGSKLRNVYEGLKPHGRFLPAGSCAGVGLSGLALGGGYGLFSREFGLTCDHLERVRLVDGRGQMRDSRDEPELLWACRGGGNGNFGVITSMEFKTRAVPTQLGSWNLRKQCKDAADMTACIKLWFEVAGNLPNPVFSALVLNGSQAMVLLVSTRKSSGPAFQAAGKAFLSVGFSSKGTADTEFYHAIKRYEGRKGPLPFHNVSAGYYRSYSDIERIAGEISATVMATSGLIYQVNTLGGEIVNGPDSAYPHRAFPMLGELQAYWEKGPIPEKLAAGHARIRELLVGAGITRHYRNYPDPDLKDWEKSYYEEAAMRLKKIKADLDPDDRIRHPQSIKA